VSASRSETVAQRVLDYVSASTGVEIWQQRMIGKTKRNLAHARGERYLDTNPPRTAPMVGGCVVVLALYHGGLRHRRIPLPILVLWFFIPMRTNQPLLLMSLACGGDVLPGYKAYQELGYKRSDAWRQYHVSTWWQM
jgi:hypothetical protein